MWAEKKNNSRTGGERQARAATKREREREKDGGGRMRSWREKKKKKRRKEEEKNTARSCRDGEAEQEARWFLSVYSRVCAAAVLCAGQPSRWWEAVVGADDLWASLPVSPRRGSPTLKQAVTPECRLMKEQHWRATAGTSHDAHWKTQPATAAAAAEPLDHSENWSRSASVTMQTVLCSGWLKVVAVAELLIAVEGRVSRKPCLLPEQSISVQAHCFGLLLEAVNAGLNVLFLYKYEKK